MYNFPDSTANLIFFGFVIILLVLPIFDRQNWQISGTKITTCYTALSHNLPTDRKNKVSSSNKYNKILGQSKATLEVKTRHFVTTFESAQFSLHQGRKVKLQHFLYRTLFDTHHVRGKQRTVFLTSG